MKNAFRTLAPISALLALAMFQACAATSGHDQASAIATKMGSLRSAVNSTKEQIAGVSASVTELRKENVDAKPAYDQFTKASDKLTDATKKTQDALRDLRTEGAAYFAEWQKQNSVITDPDIKKAAEARRADLNKSLDKAAKSVDQAAALYPPYLSRIQDARTFLSNDLTPAGIKKIDSTLSHLVSEGSEVSKALDSAVESLDEMIPAFQAAKPPPPPAK